jgi:hypothetical protein
MRRLTSEMLVRVIMKVFSAHAVMAKGGGEGVV